MIGKQTKVDETMFHESLLEFGVCIKNHLHAFIVKDKLDIVWI